MCHFSLAVFKISCGLSALRLSRAPKRALSVFILPGLPVAVFKDSYLQLMFVLKKFPVPLKSCLYVVSRLLIVICERIYTTTHSTAIITLSALLLSSWGENGRCLLHTFTKINQCNLGLTKITLFSHLLLWHLASNSTFRER